jgi:hypothetical protein
MLTAVVAVLIASLAVGAASASALSVKVRVEIKQQPPPGVSPYLHGLVDRTPVTLPDADPNPVTVNGVSCNSRSAIAALAKAVPANLWTATGTGSGTMLDKIDGHPGTVANASGAELPSWVFYAGGDQPILDPCTTPLDDKFAGTDVLVYLKFGTGDHALLFECFNGQPLILRALQESPFPTVAINTQFALPVYVQRAPGPWPDWVNTQASVTSLIVTDESNIGILVIQLFQDGSARIEFKNPGPHTIVATDFTSKADPKAAGTVGDDILHVPDRIPVCVTNGGDGYCGTVKDQQNPFDPGDPDANCVHFGNDGRCGTRDEVGPRSTVTNLKQGQVFRPKKGPTGIRGTTGVADDPAGLKDVRLRLTRVLTVKVKVKPKKRKKKRSARKSTAHASAAHAAAKKKKRKAKVRYRKVKRCFYWNEDTLLLERAKRCGTAGGRWWEADLSDLRDTFKADFAMRLPKGTYTLEVQSSDEDGRPDPPEPGRNVLRFVVK